MAESTETIPTMVVTAAAKIGKGIFLAATDPPQPIINIYNNTLGLFLGGLFENINHLQLQEHKKGHMYTDPRWNKAIEALEKSMDEYKDLDKRSWCGIVVPDPRNLPYHLFLGESGPYKENLFEFQINGIPDIIKAYYVRDLIRKQDSNIDSYMYQKNRSQKMNNLERNPNVFTVWKVKIAIFSIKTLKNLNVQPKTHFPYLHFLTFLHFQREPQSQYAEAGDRRRRNAPRTNDAN